MHNLFADFFLYFAHISTIFAFFIAGYFLTSTKYCTHLVILCAFGVLINVALKGWFKVPLADFIHHAGYAFPSGHAQFATVFYGWIGFFGLPQNHSTNENKIHIISRLIITISLILGIGYGLLYYHYHTIQDVIAGFVVGLIIIFCYRLAALRLQKLFFVVLLGLGSLIMLINFMLYNQLAPYVWFAYSAFCVLITISLCTKP